MDGLALVASASVMATVAVVLATVLRLNVASSAQVRGRLEGLMRGASVMETPVDAPLRKEVQTGPVTRLLRGDYLEQLAEDLERADINLKANEWVVLRVGAVLALGVLPLMFMGPTLAGALLTLGGAAAGYVLPGQYLKLRRKSRISKLNEQLPEALTLMSQSLKSGFGLLQSMNLVAEQMDHPIGVEFARCIHDMNVGSSAEEALAALNHRAGSNDLDIVITAIMVQRTVGGNLSEILDKVAETMRERAKLKGEITALTAQQTMTGVVVGMLPLFVGGMFYLISPDYITPLFTETIGRVMIIAGVFLEGIGLMIIKRILSIEV